MMGTQQQQQAVGAGVGGFRATGQLVQASNRMMVCQWASERCM